MYKELCAGKTDRDMCMHIAHAALGGLGLLGTLD